MAGACFCANDMSVLPARRRILLRGCRRSACNIPSLLPLVASIQSPISPPARFSLTFLRQALRQFGCAAIAALIGWSHAYRRSSADDGGTRGDLDPIWIAEHSLTILSGA